MDETDAFFTHTIVGAPLSVVLGRRRPDVWLKAQGIELDMASGAHRLSQSWRDWIVLNHLGDPAGRPRSRPGRLRRLLERHALWIAAFGLLCLAASAATLALSSV